MTEAMVAAWRAEVRDVWPDLDDDDVLIPGLFDAQLFWVWLSTWWFLPRLGQDDRPIDAETRSPRRSVVLRSRWSQLAGDAAHLGEPEVAEHARLVVAALERRFAVRENLPAYPAFR
jgi:hypothetical protein